MPVFNGGLFDESKTALLSTPKIYAGEFNKILSLNSTPKSIDIKA